VSALFADNGFSVHRGVNVSHWISQVGGRDRSDDSFFNETDLERIKELGFDHIRLPVDEVEMFDDDGQPIEWAFQQIDMALRSCEELGLKVILDLHTVRTHHFNALNMGETKSLFTDPAAQETFLSVWDRIMERTKDYPVDLLAYEIMNEPVAEDHEDWNRLVKAAHARIRALEPERTLVIGSNLWQQVDTLQYLWIPEGDPNIILSFHFYEPFPLTHYKANWTPLRAYSGPIYYPGLPIHKEDLEGKEFPEDMLGSVDMFNKEFTRDILAERVAVAANYGKEHGLQVYCGEWGCYIKTPRELRLAWYRDMVSVFDEFNVANAIWDYQGGFRIVDFETKETDQELVDILMGE